MQKPYLSPFLELTDAECVRAMRDIAQNEGEAAHRELLTVHRMARLLAQGRTWNEQALAIHIDFLASEGDATLATHIPLSAPIARSMLADLNALPQFPSPLCALDTERFCCLEALIHYSRIGSRAGITDFPGPPIVDLNNTLDLILSQCASFIPTNYNQSMRTINEFFDHELAANTAATFAQRKTLNSAVYYTTAERIQHLAFSGLLNPARLLALHLLPEMPKPYQRQFYFPGLDTLPERQTAQSQQFDLARLALALGAYHADRRAYPPTLAALSPGYLPAIPEDIFINQPLHYTLTPTGYLLYSVGPNMRDDAGHKRGDNDPAHPQADDLVISVP